MKKMCKPKSNTSSSTSKSADKIISKFGDTGDEDVILDLLNGKNILEKLKKLAYVRNDFMIPKQPPLKR